MEVILELLVELVVGGSLEGANDRELPMRLRIGLLIFASLIYAFFAVFFVWLLLTAESICLKIIAGGVLVFEVSSFVGLWRKVLKEKKTTKK